MLKLLYPTRKPFITQRFWAYNKIYKGNRHKGVDFRVWNDPQKDILACQDGTVIYIDDKSVNNWYTDGKKINGKKTSPYGVHCILRHFIDRKIYFSLYGHLEEIHVQEGQKIKAGEVLGKGGNTGMSKGAHLHFEFRKYGNHIKYVINPEGYFVETLNEEEVPEWSLKSWNWAKKKGILSKKSIPSAIVTKAELMVFLERYHNKFIK